MSSVPTDRAAGIETPLTHLFGLRHPVLLAPMAMVAGGRLAAAVSDAGGLGLIGGGYGDPDWLRGELIAAGSARIGIGFITWALQDRTEVLDMALAHRPAAIMLSFGDPRPLGEVVTAANIPLICQVNTLDEARLAMAAGADVIVAQGQEAGGHGRPGRGTLALTRAVVEVAAATPVVAAGGIADGAGLAAALSLGAAGALIGTRFYASSEANDADPAKQAIANASGDDTLRTGVFDLVRGPAWPEGYDGRALRNALSDRWHGNEAALAAELPAVKGAYEKAAAAQDLETRVVWAGEGVDVIADVPPARQVLERLIDEAAGSLAAAAGESPRACRG
ncbi:MAG: nitronate monooxygenase [Alphaproteobacteria bacterium]|jgi:nitronate monooxygenase|nr:nitronate monooxygenase [Alphaproteobacteria bacterium]MDP6815463.1 nitronate monooxygenase [Alphaproteobacteria bacterium]